MYENEISKKEQELNETKSDDFPDKVARLYFSKVRNGVIIDGSNFRSFKLGTSADFMISILLR